MRSCCLSPWRRSPYVSVNHVDQILCCFGYRSVILAFDSDEMVSNMVLHNLSHQAGRGPPNSRNQVHDLFAAGFLFKCSFDRFDLTTQAACAEQELLFVADRVCHKGHLTWGGGYSIWSK